MQLKREIEDTIISKLQTSDKGIVIYGPRQVGKTTLVNTIISKLKPKTLVINGDQSRYIDVISSRDLEKLTHLVEGFDLLFIDEAQRIPEIGINVKIILDNIQKLKVVVTGSASLDLASKISEPLTGRIWTYHLYPISFLELNKLYNRIELDAMLEDRLLYGSYPELFSIKGNTVRQEYLTTLTDAYLYKDFLDLGDMRNASKIRDLLKLLAFQVGSPVSLSELGASLGMSKETVDRYIFFLEKSYVLFRLSGFSRNLRKEVVKMDKIFFYDLGVRNILIDAMKPLKDRNDVGQLWENFLIVERLKLLEYTQQYSSPYYWRLYTGAELDYVEESGGALHGYEFKWGNKTAKAPATWTTTYPTSSFEAMNQENYLDFIL